MNMEAVALFAVLFVVPARVAAIIFAVLFGVPSLALLFAWGSFLRWGDRSPAPGSVTLKLPLFVITASCLWFFLGMFSKSAIGPDYSNRRFATIIANFVASVAMAFLSLARRHPLRRWVAIAAGIVALAWLYAWFVSAAV